MRKTVQKFIGDAVRSVLKSGDQPTGTLAVAAQSDALSIKTSP